MVFVRIQSDEDYSLKQAVRDETNKLFGKYALAGDNKAIHVVQYTVSNDHLRENRKLYQVLFSVQMLRSGES